MKRKVFRQILILCFLVLTVIEAGAANRTALVIGNGAYKISPLHNPVNDARDMATALKNSGFNVTFKINANQKTMERAIRKFGKNLREGGAGLFYYAGHGIQVKGNNYLIPIGSIIESEADVKYEAVDAGLVLGKMEDAGNDLNIVILDACRNNPFARSFRSSSIGLARMDAPKGSLIAYATAPGSLAADGEGRNGVYTKHLIRNIRKSGLKVEDVFKNVRVAVVSETSSRQIPWEASSLMGSFYFDPEQTGEKRIKKSVKEKPSPKNSYEIVFWESIKNTKNPKMFEAYIEQFPNGVFSKLARINIQEYRAKPDLNQKTSSLKNDRPKTFYETIKNNPQKDSTKATPVLSITGKWRFSCYVAGAGNIEEIIKINFKQDRLWEWTSSGWGAEPKRQSTVLEGTSNILKYIFPSNNSRCIEGHGGLWGDKCSSIIISKNGKKMNIFYKNKKMGIAEKIE